MGAWEIRRFMERRCGGASIGSRRWALLRALAAAAALTLASPAAAVDQDGQVWIQMTGRIALNDRFKLWLEVQPRLGGDGMRQLLLRPALGYHFTPYFALYQGYAWTPTFDPFNSENRSCQESLFDNRLGDLRVINRTRFEQRFIEGVGGVSLRLRHLLRLTYPIDQGEQWLAAVSDEPFFTLNDATNGPRSGFDQNRVYLGLRRQLTRSFAVELGYLHQIVNKAADDDVSSHNAYVGLDFSL
jgi:hypothetical protein